MDKVIIITCYLFPFFKSFYKGVNMQKIFINIFMGFAILTLANSLWLESAKADDIQPELDSDKPPGGRVPGGTRYKPNYRALNLSRGLDSRPNNPVENSNILTILAPQGTGYTISKQPRLCWHVSKMVKKPAILTIQYVDSLAKDKNIKPILNVPIQISKTGIQIIDLSEYNIELEIGLKYRWSISISTEEEGNLKKFISNGIIQRIEQTNEFIQKINNAKEKEKPLIYAESELWYDAISSLSDLIEKYPTDKTLQNQRSALFERVGLELEDTLELDNIAE